MPSIPRLDREHVAGDQRLAAGEPEARRLVDLEPDAVAEPEVEAVRQRLARACACAGSGSPARSTTSAATSYSARPVTPGRAAARAASSA